MSTKVTLEVSQWYLTAEKTDIEVTIPDDASPEQAAEIIKAGIGEADDWEDFGQSHMYDEWTMAAGAEPAQLNDVPNRFPHVPTGWFEKLIFEKVAPMKSLVERATDVLAELEQQLKTEDSGNEK